MSITKTVIIPACEQHHGLYSVEVSLPWCCIYCGAERGEPYNSLSYDGSKRLFVHGWKNTCGHVEKYSAIREWFKKHAATKRVA